MITFIAGIDLRPPTADDSPTKDMGWFMDFPTSATSGERSVFRPILTSGRLVFTTLIPDPSLCEAGGSSFLMVVDPTTGGRIDAPVLDVDSNGILNTSDVLPFGSGFVFASGVQSTIWITPTPNIVKTETPIQGGVPAGGEVTIGTKRLLRYPRDVVRRGGIVDCRRITGAPLEIDRAAVRRGDAGAAALDG